MSQITGNSIVCPNKLTSTQTTKFHIARESSVTGVFPWQKASNTKILARYYVITKCVLVRVCPSYNIGYRELKLQRWSRKLYLRCCLILHYTSDTGLINMPKGNVFPDVILSTCLSTHFVRCFPGNVASQRDSVWYCAGFLTFILGLFYLDLVKSQHE